MYRQRTKQYKAELKKLEALAAKERERQLAEERAHARRLAAMGEGGVEDPVSNSIIEFFTLLLAVPTSMTENTVAGLLCGTGYISMGRRTPE